MLKNLSNSKFLIPAMAILAIFAISAGFYISLKQAQQSQLETPNIEGLFWPNPKQINEFSVLDHDGKIFGLEQMRGKWSFIFFGYSHCPDVCPVTMAIMADAYKELAADNSDLQVIFASVDPERDTTEKLSQYANYFHPDFIGLGGSDEMIKSLTGQIGVAYYLNNEDQTEGYLVDHSASIFLIDPFGRLVGKLSPPHEKDKIIQQFTNIKNFINEQS